MNTSIDAVTGMNYRFQPKDPSRRVKGLVIVIVLHALMGYALVSGMARKGLNFIKNPLQAVVIQEVIIPPPPPPPPPPPKKIVEKPVEVPTAAPPIFVPQQEVVTQTTTRMQIESTPTPPKETPVIAPPRPPAPPQAPPGPVHKEIGLACPTQVAPEMPSKALQEGTEGVVRAQIRVKFGVIQEVTILSGPRVFHAAVRAAMMQYKCSSNGADVLATQDFNFKLE